jgi:RNA polymerase sigma-70 factor (ECF subfamily)
MSSWTSDKSDESTDEVLMERFQNGDTQALGVLYDRYARRIKAFAWHRGARRPDDVVQDAFMRIVRKGHGFKGRSSFKTWLFSIARNLCTDAARRDSFRVMPSLDAPVGHNDGGTLGDRFANEAPESDAHRAMENRRFRDAFERALAALPEAQREVFVLRQSSGLSFGEIATMVDDNENTVKSRMRYALTALRDALEEFHT